jgi:hypothetical protein
MGPASPIGSGFSLGAEIRERARTARLVRKGAHARLILAVDLIGQGVSVEVDAADVKAY